MDNAPHYNLTACAPFRKQSMAALFLTFALCLLPLWNGAAHAQNLNWAAQQSINGVGSSVGPSLAAFEGCSQLGRASTATRTSIGRVSVQGAGRRSKRSSVSAPPMVRRWRCFSTTCLPYGRAATAMRTSTGRVLTARTGRRSRGLPTSALPSALVWRCSEIGCSRPGRASRATKAFTGRVSTARTGLHSRRSPTLAPPMVRRWRRSRTG